MIKQIKDLSFNEDEVKVNNYINLILDGENKGVYELKNLMRERPGLYVIEIINYYNELTKCYVSSLIHACVSTCEFNGVKKEVIVKEIYKQVKDLTKDDVRSDSIYVVVFDNLKNRQIKDMYMLKSFDELKGCSDFYVFSVMNYQYDEEKVISSSIIACIEKTPYHEISKEEAFVLEVKELLKKAIGQGYKEIIKPEYSYYFNDLGMYFIISDAFNTIAGGIKDTDKKLILNDFKNKEFYEIRTFINQVVDEIFSLYA